VLSALILAWVVAEGHSGIGKALLLAPCATC
jgi:hypothetical protein